MTLEEVKWTKETEQLYRICFLVQSWNDGVFGMDGKVEGGNKGVWFGR